MAVPNGRYKFLLRALKLTGNPALEADYECEQICRELIGGKDSDPAVLLVAWLSPEIIVVD